MADATISPRVSRAKKLAININREERKNEPDLTLGHLVNLTASIVGAFSPGRKVDFPNAYSLLLLDGDNQEISARGASFPLTLTHFKGQESSESLLGAVEQKILGQFFPDDISSILRSIQFFITKEYGERQRRTFSWGYEIDSIASEISSARDIKSLQAIATGNLKRAAEETLLIIQALHQEVSEEIEVELDDAQLIISEIKNLFKTSNENTDYRKIWEDLGKESTQVLADHDRKTKIVVTANKKFSAYDTREIINAFYEQIVEQIEKSGGPEEPWDRVSPTTKSRFNPNRAPYFSTNELQQLEINISDTTKARAIISWIEQVLEEIEKEAEAVGGAPAAAEDEGGGEDVVDEKLQQEQAIFLTQEEILKRVINALVMESGEIFFEYFSGATIDPNNFSQEQQDWLLTQLPDQIRRLLDERRVRIDAGEWINNNLTLENESSRRYGISEAQFQELNKLLAEQFFAENDDDFLDLMRGVPSQEELQKKAKPIEPGVPAAGAVVPSAVDLADEEVIARKGIDVARAQITRDLTTEFLVMQFGEEGEFLRAAVYDLISSYLPANATKKDIERLRSQLFYKLQRNETLLRLAGEYYKARINQITRGNLADAANIYKTIDSIVVLSEDPLKYFSKLNDEDLLKQFGLENSNIDVRQLRILFRGLVTIRRYAAGSTIIPWLTEGDEDKKIPQALGGVRTFIKKYGEDGVAALNLDKEQIDDSDVISEHRKETVKQLYRNLWIGAVSGKSQEELIEIYEYYNVDIIQIDFSALPTPDDFIFSDMAQQANLTGPDGQSKKAQMAKKLFDKGAQKLGKAALSLVAPELAPILAALENMPIVGEMTKEVEEKAGKLVMVAAGAIGAAIAGIIKLAQTSIGALIGGGVGAVAGFFVGGIPGAIAGAGALGTAGGWLGAGGWGKIKNWFSNLGGGGGAGIGQVAQTGLGGVGSSAISTKLVPVAYGSIATGAIVTTMVAGGTQLFPSGTADKIIGEQNISRYVELTKTPSISNLENNQRETVTYTIVITPKDDYILQINTDETKDEWSYLGGDPLDLPNKTEEILNQIGDEPISQPITITYDVEMEGVDVAVSNKFDLVFSVINEAGEILDNDSLSAFATVIIGEPEIGCLVPGPGGDEWSGTRLLPWPNSEWARIMGSVERRAGTSPMFLSKVCTGGNPLEVSLLEGGFAEGYGGWAPSSFGGAKLGIYEYGMSFSEGSLEYTMIHELGHIIDYRNSDLRSQYLAVGGGDDECYTYPFKGMCSGAEAFAESITLYVVHKTHRFSYGGYGQYDFSGRFPAQYEWLKNNIFGGVEF